MSCICDCICSLKSGEKRVWAPAFLLSWFLSIAFSRLSSTPGSSSPGDQMLITESIPLVARTVLEGWHCKKILSQSGRLWIIGSNPKKTGISLYKIVAMLKLHGKKRNQSVPCWKRSNSLPYLHTICYILSSLQHLDCSARFLSNKSKKTMNTQRKSEKVHRTRHLVQTMHMPRFFTHHILFCSKQKISPQNVRPWLLTTSIPHKDYSVNMVCCNLVHF